jgi:hypothetical protein
MFSRAPASAFALAAIGLSATLGATLGAASWASPLPSGNWWEKVTVTVPAGGEASCTFTSSREAAKECALEGPAAALAGAGPEKGSTTTITFERRFDAAGADADIAIGAGDMLLGGQVMRLAIGDDGKVSGCKVIEKAADGMEPDYGCDDAAAEIFAVGQSGDALLTILIYAHNEQVV